MTEKRSNCYYVSLFVHFVLDACRVQVANTGPSLDCEMLQFLQYTRGRRMR